MTFRPVSIGAVSIGAALIGAMLALSLAAQAPAPPDALFQSGLDNLAGSQFEAAQTAFRGVAGMEPGKIRGAMGVVQVFMAQDKPADAIAFLQGEIEKNPKRVDVRVLLGDTLLRAGRPATALAEFQKALDGMDFQSASELYVRRGPLPGSYVRGRTDAMVQQALAVLGGQDATPKGSAGIYVRIAEVRITQRDFDWAIEALLKARASQPRDPIVLFNLAVVLEAGRRISEAIEAYRATLAVDPNNAIALNNLAFVLAENKGSLDEAWRYGKHAAELRPESSDIVDTLGWVALKKGWARDAAALFAQALVQQPRKADYRRHLLLALAGPEAQTPELRSLMDALKADPAHETEAQTQALLEKLKAIEKARPFDRMGP